MDWKNVVNDLPNNESLVYFNILNYPGQIFTGVYFTDGQKFVLNNSGLIVFAFLVFEWKYVD